MQFCLMLSSFSLLPSSVLHVFVLQSYIHFVPLSEMQQYFMLWIDGLLFSSSIYILWCLKNATHYCRNYREQNSIQFPDIQWEISSLGSASLFKHLEFVFGIHFQYFLFSPCLCVYVYLSLFLVVHGKLSLLTVIKRAVLHVCGIYSGRNSFWIKNFLVFHSFIRCKQNCCGLMPSFSFNNKLSISSKISKKPCSCITE